ncbi:phosphoglucosamine mutase [Actinorhabdospora filicis]|uniref:Phosphoglucosamine mutase n=1 Tax=Actinorhabdospora filicis TaxID=1785913 RepID=A0A9W6W5Z3_9ACTN|nr:phosphoglucosamine mutase [Actinorhabdospora filicis]GLZ80947.1 phosphoglucosamine mutase [Actinorhabdospora filicis]
MGRLFGTDGVRGLANDKLTPQLATALAEAAVHVLSDAGNKRPLALIGRDSRASGEMLEAAVIAGLLSVGADVIRVGVLPSPAIAYLTADTGADIGVMLSASHNPMPDNGIKFFAAGGHKLPDEVEDRIEAALEREHPRPTGAEIGRLRDLTDGAERYTAHLVSTVDADLSGLKIVVDCANGAASDVAPEALRRLGAEVIAIHAEPDGLNINENCGSTHMDSLRAKVLETGADIGFALDGDADRCLASAADGSEVDGDAIMAILALHMKRAGNLAGDTLVATVMSNLGLHHAMRDAGITLVTTAVGDRYVLETLRAKDFSLGGEQSGHIVMPAYATTGDGTLTSLHLAASVVETGKGIGELAAVVRRLPQVLLNVPVGDKNVVNTQAVRDVLDEQAGVLGEDGRILLRPSGTEPLVRVMVEADTAERAHAVADTVAAAVRAG